MTYSPGFTSGSIVMLDMMMPLFSQVETTLGETLRLFTLLGGAEAIGKKQEKQSYKAELLNTVQSVCTFPFNTHTFSHGKIL